MNAVGTNLLVYVRDPRDAEKQRRASKLVAELPDAILLWHVACEFVATARKPAVFGYSATEAIADMRQLSVVWTPALPDWRTLERAQDLMGRYRLAFWDALFISASIEAGATTLTPRT